jgi:hypothetical protein
MMKKRGIHTLIVILIALLALFLFSCKTVPEEEPAEEKPAPEEPKPEEEEEPEVEEEVEAPDAARREARSLKTYISDNDLAQYAEASFSTAETRHQKAEEAYGSDNARSAELFEEAIELYREVLEKSVKNLRSGYQSRMEELRRQARELKTENALPQEHQASMQLIDQTQTAYEEGNYRKAHELALTTLEQLERTVSRARAKREQALDALKESQASIEQTQKQIEEYEKEAALEDEAEGETGE